MAKNIPVLQLTAAKNNVIELLNASRIGQARREVQKLLKSFPKDPSIRFLAGLVGLSQRDQKSATKHFANAIRLGSGDMASYTNLATLQISAGKLDAAGKTLAAASNRFGKDVLELVRLNAVLCLEQNEPRESLRFANHCLELDDKSADSWSLKGYVSRTLGLLFEAIECYREAVRLNPSDIRSRTALSWLLSVTNQQDEAIGVATAAVEQFPDSNDARVELALRLVEAGRSTDTIKPFRQLLSDPAYAGVSSRMLAQFLPMDQLPEFVVEAKQALRLTKAPEQLGQIHLALHKAHQRAGKLLPKRTHLGTANGLLARVRPYSAKEDQDHHTAIREAFANQPKFPCTPNLAQYPTPIFIVGMIRSGTTLLERMLSNHSSIGALGEIATVGRKINTAIHDGGDFGSSMHELVAEYHQHQAFAGECAFTTDKMPGNYLYIGYLRRVFPNCKIILTMRDFRDIAISAYENYFDSPAQNFSFTEAGLLNRFRLFHETITYWRDLGGIHTVWYENLVSDPTTELRKISDFCGFEFDAAMAHPDRSTAAIRTASIAQARRPVYLSSTDRWRGFGAEHLPGITNKNDNSAITWRRDWLDELNTSVRSN